MGRDPSHNAPDPILLGPYANATLEACATLDDAFLAAGLESHVIADVRTEVCGLDAEARVATLAAAFERATPGTKGSMQQDIEAGRRTEIEVINGAIVEVAKRHGRDAPLNRTMVALVKGYEAAHLSPA
jgi:2-dehydropantoate 2-reductase